MARILYFDIESSPNLGYTWEKYEQNVLSFVKESYMLSYSYAWNDGKVRVRALPDFPGYKKDTTDDKALTKSLWELFNEADILVAHNGKKFDIRYANGRFIVHGFEPPTQYQVVDTLHIARSQFKLNSNKLDDLGRILNVGEKIETGGFDLWLGCIAGKRKEWEKMKQYNKQDVVLLREVYKKLRAWSKTHPNVAVIDSPGKPACKVCGSEQVWKIGIGWIMNAARQRWRCKKCGTNMYTSIKENLPLR